MADTHAHSHQDMIPVPLLAGMAALALASLVAVAAVRWSGQPIQTPDAPAAASRLLRFEDRPDGGIAVIDAKSGHEVERVQGEAGFVRGALRALARERRLQSVGREAAFELVGRADGRLTLVDPATGARIDLEAFGPTNAAAFARLLTAGGAPAR
jgi:putative photosynthetic complex assembly protein